MHIYKTTHGICNARIRDYGNQFWMAIRHRAFCICGTLSGLIHINISFSLKFWKQIQELVLLKSMCFLSEKNNSYNKKQFIVLNCKYYWTDINIINVMVFYWKDNKTSGANFIPWITEKCLEPEIKISLQK